MRVVHLNTTVNRSSAPYKLHKAMKDMGIDSHILALNADNNLDVNIVNRPLSYKIKQHFFAFRNKRIISKLQLKEYMPIDILPVGMDISNHPLVKMADIICIHWVNGDFLSPNAIKKIVNTGKKVYQFCHDNYPFTGGCHVRMGCEGFKSGCKNCEQIKGCNAQKYIQKIIKGKTECYNSDNVVIVSPSKWMDNNVSVSKILKERKHVIIPNVIDTDVFKPIDCKYDENLFTIICAVKSNEKIPYNGMNHLWDVLKILNEKFESNEYERKLRIIVFGTEYISNKYHLKIENMGYVSSDEQLRDLYCKSDVFLITSLEDSFNQTAAECMACGTPVVAFNNGGITDIIDHKENGYLAKLGDKDELVCGIEFIYKKIVDNQKLNTREKILANFSKEKVVNKIINI